MRTSILLMAFTLSGSVGLAQTQRSASYEKDGINGKGLNGAVSLSTGVEDNPCTEARMRAYLDEFATRLKPSVMTRARRSARSILNRSHARPSTSASARLSQFRRGVKAEVKTMEVDLSGMPVEEAVILMFMLISEDARKDMKELLADMNATLMKKSALREDIDNLRREVCHLMDEKEKAKEEGRRPD